MHLAHRISAVFVAIIATLSGCAQPPTTFSAAQPPAIPAGQARLWIYRQYEPYATLGRPYIRLNGEVLAVSEPGGAIYRNVTPGSYTLTVDSIGRDVNQFATFAVTAGQGTYIRIEAAPLWESDLNFRVDTFYSRVVAPDVAALELARTSLYDGQ